MVLNRDRTKRYQMLLEFLPKVVLIVILVCVLIALAGVVCLAVFAAPVGDLKRTSTVAIQDFDYFNGTQYFYHNVTGVVYQNVEFDYSVTLVANENVTGFTKDDVMLSALLYGRNSNSQQWKLLHQPKKQTNTTTLYRRSLSCSQTDVIDYIMNPDGYQNLVRGVYKCQPITVFKERALVYKQYRAAVTFTNLGPLYENGLLVGLATTQYKMTYEGYSKFQLAFRYSYGTITFIFFLIFVGVTFKCQQLSKWHTPQKWLAPLMLLSIWYHDPLYAATLYTSTWIFPFVTTIFELAFIYGFLLYLLIFFHSLLQPPKDRTFLNFYISKIVLVGTTYVLSNILLLWARIHNSKDAAKFSVTEVPGYKYLRAILISFLVIYALDLLYYIVKALGVIRRMRTKYSNRFWAVGSFSCLVVLSFLAVTITNSGFKYSSQALAFLVSHTIIFLYFIILSVLFLPGWHEDIPEAKVSEIAVNVDDAAETSTENVDVSTRQLSENETKEVISEKHEPQREQNLNPDQIRVTFNNYSYEDDEHL